MAAGLRELEVRRGDLFRALETLGDFRAGDDLSELSEVWQGKLRLCPAKA
jgi:hypothetical protein